MSRMLDAFIQYERETRGKLDAHSIVGVPVGTRLQRIIRGVNGWTLWVATRDYKHGTYYVLHNTGLAENITVRGDEGDNEFVMRPSDDTIRRR